MHFLLILLFQKEKQELEERLKREAMEVDYLAPFLAQISDPEQLTKLEASTVQKACLEDLRHRLLEKANLIQKRFEKVNYISYYKGFVFLASVKGHDSFGR